MTEVKYVEEKALYIRRGNNYGATVVYPVCEQACIFAELLGTKTLTLKAINGIKRLGYTFRFKDNEDALAAQIAG